MKQSIALLVGACLVASPVELSAQARTGSVISVPDNMTAQGVPPVPAAIHEAAAPYNVERQAALLDWNPVSHALLIGTRFGDTTQVHAVEAPGGARRQLTFLADPVKDAKYLQDGKSLLLEKDAGGDEWFQFYLDRLDGSPIQLLTDGHSRNIDPLPAHRSDRLAFSSTHRNGKDTDIWSMDVHDPASARLLLQVEGGGWSAANWSHDNSELLVTHERSANAVDLYLVDVASGAKTLLTRKSSEPVADTAAVFARDDGSIYLLTDRDSEFQRLAHVDLKTMTWRYLTSTIPWDVETMQLSEDGHRLAFATNEAGCSHLYILDTANDSYREVGGLPVGVISKLAFHSDSHTLAFDMDSARSPLDVYVYAVYSGKLQRWTSSETGGVDTERFAQARLIHWKSFDGQQISGFLNMPDPQRFPGRRPVMISIHGGPEQQSRPHYFGQLDYLTDQLGIAIVHPNIRGSSGFGKSFLRLDDGLLRDHAYKDIGTLLDWIGQQPDLDPSRVMVTGASYGGNVAWAVAWLYDQRIRGAIAEVGPSNLVTFLEHTEAYRRDLRRAEYGDERDPKMRAYLEKIAPFNHSEAIHKPILAVAGRNDPRVPFAESKQMVDKLVAQGTPVWFLAANDEGHGFDKKKNIDFEFDATVLFVKTYLLGNAAAGPSTRSR